MSGILFNAGVDPERDEAARRAVKAFRAMQPTLTAYAKMITKRRDVRVELASSSTPATDDKRIFYRPPIGLGDSTSHERRLCDKRDENMQPLCPACLIRERVLISIYHEIGHIAKGSFTQPTPGEIEVAFQAAMNEMGGQYADKVKQRFDHAPAYAKKHLTGLAALVNDYLPFLVNCLEDARVDREMYKARKGLKAMFDADVWRTFEKGMEGPDGELRSWKDNPQNSQVMVGVYCKAAGYDVSNWFIPPVVEALADEKLTDLIRRIDTVRSASGTYQLAFSVLVRLRELGFCGTPNDPDPQPQPDGEGDEPDPNNEEDSDGQGEAAESGGEGEGSSDSSSEQPSSDSSEGSGDREPEEGEGSDGSDDGSQPGPSDPSQEAGTDGGLGDELDSTRDSQGSEVGDQEPDGSESGDESSDDTSSESSQGDESQDNSPEQRSDDSPEGQGEPDKGESDSSMGTPEAGDSSESGDRSESSSGDHDDSIGDDAQGGGSTGEQEVSDEQDAASGGREPEVVPPDHGNGDPGEHSSEGDDSSYASDDGSVDAGSDGDPERGEPGGSVGGEHPAGDDLDTSPDLEEVPGERGSDLESPEPEPYDNGTDEGMGGVEIIENEKYDHVPMGTADQLDELMDLVHPHPEQHEKTLEEELNEEAVDRAIIQGLYFETPSRYVFGVREHHYGEPIKVNGAPMSKSWQRYEGMDQYERIRRGMEGDFETEERILGPALLDARTAFADNQRGAYQAHRKSGKVNTRVLGKRAAIGDERLFRKKMIPGKKDYFVLIGMDVSGSTVGRNIMLEKKAVMAQATLLDRLGIPFSIYAHTGDHHDPFSGRAAGVDLDIYHIKGPNDPWNPEVQERLLRIGPSSFNLDGHTLEYYRKRLDEQTATNKILLYYTDGKMPAENYDEELEILQREIRYCRAKNYTLLGVGIRTDSPVRHGLDTVQVDEDADLIKVVQHLEKRLV